MNDEMQNRLQGYLRSGKSLKTAASLCGVSLGMAQMLIGSDEDSTELLVTEDIEDVKELAKRATLDAVSALVDVARNSKSDAARVAAATALLDRGYGKPAQTTVLQGVTAINIVGLDIAAPMSMVEGRCTDVTDIDSDGVAL